MHQSRLVINARRPNTTSLAMSAVPNILTTTARLLPLSHTTLCCPMFASGIQKVEP